MKRITAVLWAIVALPPVTASAQEPSGQLEEVIVTAERRAENIRDVPSSISTVSREDLDVLSTGGQDVRLLAARVPESQRRVVVRPRIPALLHSRLRQWRFPPERFAARLAHLRRGRAGKPHPQGLSHFRPGSDRSAARTAGHLVRPQYARRRGQVRLGQACFRVRRLPQRIRCHVQHRELRRRDQRPFRRGLGRPRVSGLYQHRDDFVGNSLTGDKGYLRRL